jgi:DNA gyrase subunit A
MKVYKLPVGSPTSNGRAVINLLPLAKDEKIATILVLPEDVDMEKNYLMFATSVGNVRRSALGDFQNINANGKKAIRMDEGENLVGVALCSEEEDVMLSTKKGICNRFNATNVRVFQSRDSNGVRGIRLSEGDSVIAMSILHSSEKVNMEDRNAYLKISSKQRQLENALNNADDGDIESIEEVTAENENLVMLSAERVQQLAQQEQFILAISENGFGKRTSAYEYRTTNRGSSGFDAMSITPKTGGLVGIFPVEPNDQILLVTDKGRLIRCPIADVRITGRRAQGVIVFRVNADEKVVSVSSVGAVEGDEESLEVDNTLETVEVVTEE